MSFRHWIPVIVYVGVMFYVSSLSNPLHISRLCEMDPRRYSLHFLEYFGLGVLLYFALHKSWLSRRALILTLIIGSAIGVSDELFQASIPGRRLNPLDIISNGIGMLLGALTFFAAKYEEILNIGRR